jgi:hypothetical protein
MIYKEPQSNEPARGERSLQWLQHDSSYQISHWNESNRSKKRRQRKIDDGANEEERRIY